jgi:hypothetical protein
MEQNVLNLNPVSTAAMAAGLAGGAALLAPVAVPAIHGIAGLAVAGFGFYATGSAVVSTTRMISEKATGAFNDGALVVELLRGTVQSKPEKRVPAREVPFRKH